MRRTVATSSAKAAPKRRSPRVAFLATRKRVPRPCSRMRSVPTAASRRRSCFGLDLAVVRENSIRQESVHPSLGSKLTDHSIVALFVELGLHRVKELTIEDCGLLAGKYFA